MLNHETSSPSYPEMSNKHQSLHGFRDEIVQSQVYRKRDRFLASISEQDVHNLAKSYRNNMSCHFFQDQVRGSFNICYFVEFDDGTKWVIRIPLEPCLAFGARSKLESEIATMKVVAEQTNIPIPNIIAYELGDDSKPLSSFLIIEYVEGQKLSFPQLKSLSADQRRQFYTSLADIYIQLRRLEFPAIGCLTTDLHVCKEPVTIDANMQQLEGLEPSHIQDTFYALGPLASADDYTTMQLLIASNALLRSRNSIFDLRLGREALYHHHLFRCFANKWVDRNLDSGPFVLVHGDLQPWNLLLNERMEIVSVIDWEWSRVVPRQYFLPPLWLLPLDFTHLVRPVVYDCWLKVFSEFQDNLEKREMERYGTALLHREWTEASKNGGFLVASALENWTDVEWVAHRYIGTTQFRGDSDLEKRVQQFLQQGPTREWLVQEKLKENARYENELAQFQQTRSRQVSSGKGSYIRPSAMTARFVQFCSYLMHYLGMPPSQLAIAASVLVVMVSFVHWEYSLRAWFMQ